MTLEEMYAVLDGEKEPMRLNEVIEKINKEWQARLEAAVLAEREACAVLAESPAHRNAWIAAEIRARGKQE